MGLTGPDGHDRRVSELCVMIGRELGMSPAQQLVVSRSGLMHDVGKLGIPQSILDKRGPLTESEWRVMKTHPELGIAILGGTGRITREMLGVLYHHERMDGPATRTAWRRPRSPSKRGSSRLPTHTTC